MTDPVQLLTSHRDAVRLAIERVDAELRVQDEILQRADAEYKRLAEKRSAYISELRAYTRVLNALNEDRRLSG